MANIFNRVIICFTVALFSLATGCCHFSARTTDKTALYWSVFCCDLDGNPIKGALVMLEIEPVGTPQFHTYHPVYENHLVTSEKGIAFDTTLFNKTDAVSIRVKKDGYQDVVLPFVAIREFSEKGMRISVVMLTDDQADLFIKRKGVSLDFFFYDELLNYIPPGLPANKYRVR